MYKEECAPEPASSGRADGRVDRGQSSRDRSADRQSRSRNLDAAVLGSDHPEAAQQARLVPDGAHVVSLGGAVVGYFKPARSSFALRSRRAHEIETLFAYRFPAADGVLPLPDDEVAFARALVAHAAPGEARAALIRWRVEMNSDVERILCDPRAWARRFKADTLGILLGLTEDERSRLGITTFRAAGSTASDQEASRRTRDRERKRAARARQTCGTTRPLSVEKQKPWEGAGMSRRDWYRKGMNKAASRNVAPPGTARVRSNIREVVAADKSSAKGATNGTARDAILAALAAPISLREIEAKTGLSSSTVRPWLARLRKAGLVEPMRRGVWTTTATGRARQRAVAHDQTETIKGKVPTPKRGGHEVVPRLHVGRVRELPLAG